MCCEWKADCRANENSMLIILNGRESEIGHEIHKLFSVRSGTIVVSFVANYGIPHREKKWKDWRSLREAVEHFVWRDVLAFQSKRQQAKWRRCRPLRAERFPLTINKTSSERSIQRKNFYFSYRICMFCTTLILRETNFSLRESLVRSGRQSWISLSSAAHNFENSFSRSVISSFEHVRRRKKK